MKRWKMLATIGVVVSVGSLLAAVPAEATVIKPTATGFAPSSSTLYNTGGTVTLSATVSNATSCVFSANKALTGLPYTATPCSGLVSHVVTLPANTGKKAVKYTFKLSATGTGKANAKPIAVTVGTGAPPLTVATALSTGSSGNT